MPKTQGATKKNTWGGKRANQTGRPPKPEVLKLHLLPLRVNTRHLIKLDEEVKRMNNHKSREGKKPITRSDIVRRLLDLYL